MRAPSAPDPAALALFERALDRAAGERRAFIEANAGDARERDAALALLAAHDASVGFLEPRPAAPREIGPYRLIAPLGSGGMGQVWLAERHDGAYQQRVAIKVLASTLGDPQMQRRAEAERQFLAWLDHPNIAHVLDGGSTAQGQPYVVMEYVDGEAIDAWCRAQSLDPAARVRLFLQVLGAIDAAHRALIIHRDIKPANVLVTRDGTAKLLDFGIAKSLDERVAERTRTGLAPMTPEYASPEQLTGEPLTTATDVYGLGLLLYELLSGSKALRIENGNLAAFARRLVADAPTRPSQRIDAGRLAIEPRAAADWKRRIAGDLDRIVLKALAPEPANRYESARAFADDLERWLGHRPVLARPAGIGYRLAKFAQRNRLAVAIGAIAFVALAAGLSYAFVQQHRAATEGERAMRGNRFLIDMIARADPYTSGTQPTLVDALDRAVLDIPQQLSGQPLLEADVRGAIGKAYVMLERNDAARAQLERAEALRAPGGGTEYARILDALALLEWNLAHTEAAEALFKRALPHCAGDANGLTQRSELLNDYSSLLSELGRYREAYAMATEAQAIKDHLPEVPAKERAIGLSNVAAALDGLGRYEESHATYLRALKLLEQSPTPLPLVQSTTLNNIAYVEQEMGRLDLAVSSQQRSIALSEQVMGKDFPRLAPRWSNLAQQYAKLGRHDDARRAIDEALRLAPKAFAANDQMLGHLYTGAANVAAARGDDVEAARYARDALAVYDRADAVEPGRRDKALSLVEAAKARSAAASSAR